MSYAVPDLPYAYDALEPIIDSRTMQLHHDKHHVAYTSKLNDAITGTEFDNQPVEEILRQLDKVPESIRPAVRNNGGGYINHNLFWEIMGPDTGGTPCGELAGVIDNAFGDFKSFQNQFAAAAATRFGSGWAWVVINIDGSLEINSTANQDSPYMEGNTPILGLDVWEHAYYLNYQNRRPEYISAWWNVVNWDSVAQKFSAAR